MIPAESQPIEPAEATESRENRRFLLGYYEHALKRILHEYDQRDRDFTTHITINAGLFAALGFTIQLARSNAPGSWVVTAALVLLLCIFGTKAARALLESVRSFTHWQRTLNVLLASIEQRLLPEGVIGTYQRIAQLDKTIEGRTDLIETREALARTLLIAWRILALVSLVATAISVAAVRDPKLAAAIRSLWN